MSKNLKQVLHKGIPKLPIRTGKEARHHHSLTECKSEPQGDTTTCPQVWL